MSSIENTDILDFYDAIKDDGLVVDTVVFTSTARMLDEYDKKTVEFAFVRALAEAKVSVETPNQKVATLDYDINGDVRLIILRDYINDAQTKDVFAYMLKHTNGIKVEHNKILIHTIQNTQPLKSDA